MQNACEVDMDLTGVVNVTSGDTGEIPTFDLTAMGAEPGKMVLADTAALYDALTSGRPTRCAYDQGGAHYVWDVLGIKVTQGTDSTAMFYTFIVADMPVLVNCLVDPRGAFMVSFVTLQQAQELPVN